VPGLNPPPFRRSAFSRSGLTGCFELTEHIGLAGPQQCGGAVVGQFEGTLFSCQSQPERACQSALQAYPLHTQNDSQRDEDHEDEADYGPTGDREWPQPQKHRRDKCSYDDDSVDHPTGVLESTAHYPSVTPNGEIWSG
jgi:hypothetical protein